MADLSCGCPPSTNGVPAVEGLRGPGHRKACPLWSTGQFAVATDDELVIWVNAERTVLVRRWRTGKVEVALRESAGHIWGPPVEVEKETT